MGKQDRYCPVLCEQLEDRLHVSATPTEAHVSFLPGRLSAASGYVADHGETYGDRTGGLVYGWNISNRGSMRYRRSRLAPDTRYQTFALLPYRRRSPLTWEIALPDGTYDVHLVAGDGSAGSRVQIAAEGLSVLTGRTTRATRWIEATVSVAVSGGRLTITAGSHGRNALDFIDVVPLVSRGLPPPQPVPESPFHGTPVTATGTIEAEDFDAGSAGIAFHVSSTTNLGASYRQTPVRLDAGGSNGYHVTAVAGDWLKYTAEVPSAGRFMFQASTANASAGGQFHLEIDGADVTGELAVPENRGAAVWQTVSSRAVSLTAGTHVLRVSFDSAAPSGTVGQFDTFRFAPAPLGSLTWRQVAPIPVGLTEAMGEVVGGKLYVFGGYTDTTYVPANATFCYDPATNAWGRRANMPVGSTHTGTAADDRYVYLAGGDPWNAAHTAQAFGTRAVWRYDTVTDAFSSLPPLPEARGRGALVLIGRELHYISGCDAARIDRHEHWVLDLDNPSGWVARAPIPIARNHPGSAVLNGKLYMIGGAVGEDAAESVLDSVEVYDPATDGWSEAPPLPTRRALLMNGADVLAGRIIVAGGETAYNTPTDQVTVFDPAANQWTQLTPLPLRRTSGILRIVGGILLFTTGHPGFNTTTWAGTFA